MTDGDRDLGELSETAVDLGKLTNDDCYLGKVTGTEDE